MTRSAPAVLLGVPALLLLVSCGDDGHDPADTTSATVTSAATSEASTDATIEAADESITSPEPDPTSVATTSEGTITIAAAGEDTDTATESWTHASEDELWDAIFDKLEAINDTRDDDAIAALAAELDALYAQLDALLAQGSESADMLDGDDPSEGSDTTTPGTGHRSGGQYLSVAAGSSHTCALDHDGYATCWGDLDWGQFNPPDEMFTDLDGGMTHTCGIRSDATLRCWGGGDNVVPDSGLWSDAYDNVSLIAPSGRFIDISMARWSAWDDSFTASRFYACGVDTGKSITCWSSLEDDPWGVLDPPEGSYTSVETGESHACALREDRTVECWGNQRLERLSAPPGEFAELSVGAIESCGLRADGTVECWASRYEPPEGQYRSLVVGGSLYCALGPDDKPVCWGDPMLGDAIKPPAERFKTISAGGAHVCGILFDDHVLCWGVGAGAEPPT